MEIPTSDKTALQSVDTYLEQAFADGVTSAGDFLPKLTNYTKITPEIREQGRQGVLSTFAALLAGLKASPPIKNYLQPENNFQYGSFFDPFGSYSTNTAWYFKDLNGEVAVQGSLVAVTNLAANTIVAHLPSDLRPAVGLRFVVTVGSGTGILDISSDGTIVCESALNGGDVLDFGNIRFIPA